MTPPTKQSGSPRGAAPVAERGTGLLQNPHFNKGTAFSRAERAAFGLEGLLPDQVSDLPLQVSRVHAALQSKGDPLEQYIGLVALQDRNEVLFYRLLLEHVETYLPIVYTPTVGLATQRYSEIFRRPRGVWITPRHRGSVARVLANAPSRDVRLIVATDAERILGLGDQGAGGMGIPIGKLALYTLGAGIDPRLTLPVCLDVGTDNEELRNKDLYLGLRQPRLRGAEYDALVEEFVAAVQELFPRALLQWEDFKKVNAMRILERYRKRILSFNDDIQGTAAVALAGVLAGVRATGTALADQRIVMSGAGAAGIGIADQIGRALRRAGVGDEEIRRRIAVVDSRGLLVEGRAYREGEEYKNGYSWPRDYAASLGLTGDEISLAEVVAKLRPTVLIGVSGQPGVFTEDLVRSMAAGVERPLVFPFSNPTSQAEARPADVIPWTEGRALVATGSPFEPVAYGGRTWEIGQGNNVYIFPGVGLGALVAEAREVTEEMFTAAAETLASEVGDGEIERGLLYPSLRRLRAVSHGIARAAARQAAAQEVAPPLAPEELERRLADWIWEAEYRPLVPA
ncbi:MAG: NAD-dependent malic enzyme [Acidobacteriota bacterium]|nr:NAD-dependent malic enzyme [Acidobacteriota bacterium]